MGGKMTDLYTIGIAAVAFIVGGWCGMAAVCIFVAGKRR
jgi:hypothetical protein